MIRLRLIVSVRVRVGAVTARVNVHPALDVPAKTDCSSGRRRNIKNIRVAKFLTLRYLTPLAVGKASGSNPESFLRALVE